MWIVGKGAWGGPVRARGKERGAHTVTGRRKNFDFAHRSIQNLRFAAQAKLAQASKRSKRPLAY